MRALLCGEVPVASQGEEENAEESGGRRKKLEEEVLEVCGANLIDTGAQTKRGGTHFVAQGVAGGLESGVGSQEVSEG